jgi:hypothetical protein
LSHTGAAPGLGSDRETFDDVELSRERNLADIADIAASVDLPAINSLFSTK